MNLDDIERCFGGAIPAVLATASADGVPNITFISRAHKVDDERVALSNQFMSKTARNLAENPRADVLLIDPVSFEEFRLSLVYERTDRRGHVFDRLRADIEALAAMEGMQDVFRLRAADIFRVVEIVQIPSHPSGSSPGRAPARAVTPELAALAELAARLGRTGDLDALVDVALVALDQLLGYRHTMLLLLDEDGRRLFTIASRGFDGEHVGAEVIVGEGPIGIAAERCEPFRVGGLWNISRYARTTREQFEGSGGVRPGPELQVPGLPDADSRLVVPIMALGELVGVLVAESTQPSAFGVADEQLLGIAGSLLAHAIRHGQAIALDDELDPAAVPPALPEPPSSGPGGVTVRHFAVDASTFFDGEYVIKGVAGRILWTLLRQYVADGRVEFTNRELRLDPTLDLPGFKDNLESRLILLKRRLDERGGPITIEKTGRGRFRIHVAETLHLE
jgi:predicted pyridoxine 5'-phosphate oxidase superfamily flavin-nucleotide-binding protein